MGIREKLNQNSGLVAVVVGVIIVAAAIMIFLQSDDEPQGIPNAAYYTVDDGKTFFSDRIDQIVPFDKDGKPAVRAHVYEVDGKRVVGFMTKMKDDARAAVAKYVADMAAGPKQRPASADAAVAADAKGWLYKKPGEPTWTPGRGPSDVGLKTTNGQPAIEVNP